VSDAQCLMLIERSLSSSCHPQTGISRGFAFIYMSDQEGATKAKESMNGTELHGRQVRVDYSLTSKPHDSTPGQYIGHTLLVICT
jgi:RNA recognition motif-containing protein